jgi:hypothetical protein
MSAATDQKDPAPRKTGDAQYRAEKAAIAERNDAARKAGKAMRQEEEKKAAARRRALDIAERDSLGSL